MVRILFIDDEIIYHKMISKTLEPLGYHVDTASSGKEALKKVSEIHPDLIITDVMMPDMSGYDITRTLRRDARFSYIPILVLTAQTDLQNKLASFEAGVDDYLTKPFIPDELVARLSALLRRSEAARKVEPASQMGITARNIAVHSLRGGTGCSSLAVNLAVGLNSLWDLPTILIDLTMVAGQVALMLNTPLRRTWADVARFNSVEFDKEALDSVISQHDSGLSFIAAPTFPAEAELISGETLSKAIGLLRQRYEYIIADLPHDFSVIAVGELDEADLILMVISPDLASIRAAAAALDTYTRLNYPPEKIKVVLNATFPKHGISSDKIESALSAPITITIPYTLDKFVEAINSGLPIILNQSAEPITGLMEDFAFHISKDQHKKIKPENPTDSWKRVYKRYNERKRK